MELVQGDARINKKFYLTGGTALAAFYYSHRLSEDIDLFCEKEEIDPLLIEAFLKKVAPEVGIISFKGTQILGLVSYKLIFKDKKELKVDFNYYPFPRIAKGKKFKNLEVDSVYDIAANKIHTIFMKPRIRDYIDVYFILQREKYNLNDLIINAKAKFDWDIDRVNLASQFIRIKDFLKEKKDFPKMLVKFAPKEMEDFFLNLAKSLEREIFR